MNMMPMANKADNPMGRLEKVISSVMDDLFSAVDTCNALQGEINTLVAALNDERMTALNAHQQHLVGLADAVQAEVAEAKVFITDVSASRRHMAHHLKDLNESTQSANIVSLNARIIAQGHRHIKQGAHMVRLSDDITDITDTASGIVQKMLEVMERNARAIEEITQIADNRAEENKTKRLPKLAELSAIQDALKSAMGVAKESAEWLNSFNIQAAKDMSTIISSMQIGDRSRQRMEHVQAIRDEARSYGLKSPEGRVLSVIADRQEIESTLATEADVKRATDRLMAFSDAMPEFMDRSRALLMVFSKARLEDAMAIDFAEDDAAVAETEAELRGSFKVLMECDSKLREYRKELDDASFQMQLVSINTIIACARIGRDAADMIVISQQINEVISEVPEIVGRFSKSLEDTRKSLESSSLNKAEGAHAVEEDWTPEQTRMVRASQQEITQALPAVSSDTRQMANLVARATGALQMFAKDLEGAAQKARRTTVADLPGGFEANAHFRTVLDSLRKTYTMPEERALHDEIVSQLSDVSDIPPPVVQEEAASDDLSDILF